MLGNLSFLLGMGFEADIHRRVYSILGLPFDALSMDEVVARLYSAIDTKQKCFVSTPNLNFLAASQTQLVFWQSVINSDLSLADGMPLIWIARLLGIPLKERLAGSGLIEVLMHSRQRAPNPLKVYFFGGMDGVADLACQKVAEKSVGLRCVGSLSPGFGSIEEISEPSIIEGINNSGAQFIIVSLGAEKGQRWIEHNRHRLDAPVISHLGAVVNFIAGTVDRAPLFWQRTGLEWLWRVKQEPALWKRYFFDGLIFLKLIFTRVLPYAFLISRNQNLVRSAPPFSMDVHKSKGRYIITLKGAVMSGRLQCCGTCWLQLYPETMISV